MNRIVFYSASLLLLQLLDSVLSQEDLFVILSLFPVAVGFIELNFAYKTQRSGAFFSPVLLCTFLLFGINFGLTNFYYFFEKGQSTFSDLKLALGRDYFSYLNDTLFWVNGGLLTMWAGYFFIERKDGLTQFFKYTTLDRLLSQKRAFNWPLLNFFFICSVVAKIYLIQIGSFGFTMDLDLKTIEEKGSLPVVLNLISQLGHLIFVIYCIHYFSTRQKLLPTVVIFGSELFFGFISGFKFEVMFPFIVVLLAEFIVHRRVKLFKVGMLVCSVAIAYATVEPFRAAFLVSREINTTYTISDIIEIYEAGNTKTFEREEEKETTFDLFLLRNNLTTMAAKAFYYHEVKNAPIVEMDYSKRMGYLPLMAYLPRSLWPDKPVNNLGRLFNQKVLGASELNETSVTPSIFGYIVLGLNSKLLILPLLFILGVLQAVVFRIFLYGTYQATIIYLAALSTLINLSDFSSVMIFFMRDLPLGIVVVMLLFKKHRYSESRLPALA